MQPTAPGRSRGELLMWLWAALSVAVGLWVFGTGAAAAAPATPRPPAEVSVTTDTAEVLFPNEVRFRLVATSPSASIERVTLLYSLDGSPVINEGTPIYRPGRTISATYAWRVREVLVPGAEITYQWAIETAAGTRWTTEPQQITFNDTRFEWHQATDGQVTIYWYGPDQTAGPTLLGYIGDTLHLLRREYQLALSKEVKVFVYTRPEDYAVALAPFRASSVGMTVGTNRIFVLLVAPPAANERTVRHEIVHALFLQQTENAFNDAPRWLSEGFSMFLSGEEIASGNMAALRQLARQDRLFSLKSLNSSFPSTRQEQALAYIESYSAVRYIIEKHGADKLRALLQAISEGNTTDDAFKQVLGVTVDELDKHWRDAVKKGEHTKPSRAPRAHLHTAEPLPPVEAEGPLGRTFAFWRRYLGDYTRPIVIGFSAIAGVGLVIALAATLLRREPDERS